jgi:hypothetical protein
MCKYCDKGTIYNNDLNMCEDCYGALMTELVLMTPTSEDDDEGFYLDSEIATVKRIEDQLYIREGLSLKVPKLYYFDKSKITNMEDLLICFRAIMSEIFILETHENFEVLKKYLTTRD